MLNEFFSEMVEVIMKYDGTLDKFVGDEIMAFWGAPVEQPDHPERAVRCAIEMIERLRALHESWSSEDKPLLEMGIGVNTGEVLVGNIGVQGKKMDYTVIGDHVNLAARLEAETRKMGLPLIISQFTYERIPEELKRRFQPLGEVRVKGRTQTVQVYGFSP
ncbi:MAG: adenylate/guanylate cyclase domain-containing protein [Nitrospirae bacterium]|nr:MAG: adenylate/guanylate cyclase domain-containing protein [Nitrospirota bacterium]